jgi:uncharacterized membrane protein
MTIALVAAALGFVILVFVVVALARGHAFGMVPFIPVAAGGIYMIFNWLLKRQEYKKFKQDSRDLDQELRDLIEGK